MKAPPNTLDPKYPADSIIGGRPPSTMVAPVVKMITNAILNLHGRAYHPNLDRS